MKLKGIYEKLPRKRRIKNEKKMNTARIKAYAKVNITLEITGVENGFHVLDSLVTTIDLFDAIVLKKRKDKLSSVTMHGLGSEQIPPEKNNALKAAEAFSARFQTCGADIIVHKNIPMGAGLGGSSADVAGVLQGMAKLYNIQDENALCEIADLLGSDTRYMLKGGFMRMRGRGNVLTATNITKRLYMLLICPPTDISTSACYKKYDELPKTLELRESATENCIALLEKGNVNEVGRYATNDLFVSALHLNDDVRKAYEEARSFSPISACMTGSGSCVVALFETKELCEWAKSRYKGKFRVLTTQTIDPQALKRAKKWRNPFVLSEEDVAGE